VQAQVFGFPVTCRCGSARNACGIGRDTRDSVLAQGRIHVRPEPRDMSRLASDRAMVAFAQLVQERQHNPRIEGQARRQLQQQDAEFRAEATCLIEKCLHLRAAVAQTFRVTDGLGHFHREAKTCRHRFGPACIGLRLVGPVERRIDFHRIEGARVAFKMSATAGKRAGLCRCDRPACAADEDHGDTSCHWMVCCSLFDATIFLRLDSTPRTRSVTSVHDFHRAANAHGIDARNVQYLSPDKLPSPGIESAGSHPAGRVAACCTPT